MLKQILSILLVLSCFSCKKFLDEKPSKRLSIPSTVKEFQALLDVSSRMNNNNPAIGEIAADNYFLKTTDWLSMIPADRNAYIWDTAIYTNPPNDWGLTYDPVYYANLALEGIDKIERTTQNEAAWNNVKGSALLLRAKSFLTAVWIWSKAYDVATAGSDLGVPLRLSSDFNKASKRATVQQCYDRILEDLKQAVPLLPVMPLHVMRPSRPAAYALLARTSLSMRQYEKALLYADSSLQLFSSLLDYNTLNPSAGFPFQRFNAEVIMHSSMPNIHLNISPNYARVDTLLYNSYAGNDLRKSLFFKSNSDGTRSFKGSYDNGTNNFNGITSAELYLTRAECLARAGRVTEAMNDLNTLLVKRWKNGTFIPLTATDAAEALDKILLERRKELVFRDLRWTDIKRLNKEGKNISLERIVDNRTYVLPANDNRYALPLPEDIIALTGMSQNPG